MSFNVLEVIVLWKSGETFEMICLFQIQPTLVSSTTVASPLSIITTSFEEINLKEIPEADGIEDSKSTDIQTTPTNKKL